MSFTWKCLGAQIKAFSFLFYTTCGAKSTKGASVNIKSDCKVTWKKKRLIQGVYMQWRTTKRCTAFINRILQGNQ